MNGSHSNLENSHKNEATFLDNDSKPLLEKTNVSCGTIGRYKTVTSDKIQYPTSSNNDLKPSESKSKQLNTVEGDFRLREHQFHQDKMFNTRIPERCYTYVKDSTNLMLIKT